METSTQRLDSLFNFVTFLATRLSGFCGAHRETVFLNMMVPFLELYLKHAARGREVITMREKLASGNVKQKSEAAKMKRPPFVPFAIFDCGPDRSIQSLPLYFHKILTAEAEKMDDETYHISQTFADGDGFEDHRSRLHKTLERSASLAAEMVAYYERQASVSANIDLPLTKKWSANAQQCKLDKLGVFQSASSVGGVGGGGEGFGGSLSDTEEQKAHTKKKNRGHDVGAGEGGKGGGESAASRELKQRSLMELQKKKETNLAPKQAAASSGSAVVEKAEKKEKKRKTAAEGESTVQKPPGGKQKLNRSVWFCFIIFFV